MARLLVIGATGPMGRAVLQSAQTRGASVRAFARHPDDLAGVVEDVAQGDVRRVDTIENALDGVETVVSVLGSRPRAADAHLLEEGTRNIIAAMQARDVSRLICVTGMGAGDSRGHGPMWYDGLVRPLILRKVYADKDRQEELVRRSGLGWTLVRPAVLVGTPRSKPVMVKDRLARGERMGPLTRDDVAHFLIEETLSPQHVGQTVHLYT